MCAHSSPHLSGPATAMATAGMSFKANVEKALPEAAEATAVYEAIFSVFEMLPVAALVGGQVLVLHGGIGDGSWGLDELRHKVPRPCVASQNTSIITKTRQSFIHSFIQVGRQAGRQAGRLCGISGLLNTEPT